jgi:ribosomal protein S18 acetylase RimI-like enzyme
LRIEPLHDDHDRTAFESGVEPLDRYLRTQASQDIRKRVASCFVLTDGSAAPLGYYTLAATSISLRDLPASLSKNLPRYPAVPATLMGRLAVDARHRGQRFGELLLLDAFSRTLRAEIATYAFVVDAKDEAAAGFYRAYGFQPLTAEGRRMFIPMAEIAKLFA